MERKKDTALQKKQGIIVQAALELFAARGYEKVTMDDVARQSGYSKRTVYQYFSSKDSIYYAAVLDSFQNLHDTILTAANPELFDQKRIFSQTVTDSAQKSEADSKIRLRALFFDLCAALWRLYREKPLAFDAMLRFSGLPDADSPYADELGAIYETGEQINTLIGSFLAKLAHAGLIKENLPPVPTIFTLWSSLTGLFSLAKSKSAYLECSAGMTADTFLEYSFELLFRSIAKQRGE